MKTNIQAVNFTISERLQEYANKKIAKLAKLNDEIATVEIYLEVVKPETALNKEARIKIIAPNTECFASKVCDSFEEAIDLSIDALERQIKKQKEKMAGK